MFTSKQQLCGGMGVDPEIAAFFVDRKVPGGNMYWKGRYLYVARGTGFLFIPLFFDLQWKAGIEKEFLLSENYVGLMEKILHQAACYEFGELDFESHIRNIDEIVEPHSRQPWFLEGLRKYFSRLPLIKDGELGTSNSALNRGDALLYLLTVPDVPADIIRKAIDYWYLLVPSFLLMDDIMDLKEDQEKNEESSMWHYGFDAAGVRAAVSEVESNFTRLEEVNALLGQFFRSTLDQKKQTPYFQMILND